MDIVNYRAGTTTFFLYSKCELTTTERQHTFRLSLNPTPIEQLASSFKRLTTVLVCAADQMLINTMAGRLKGRLWRTRIRSRSFQYFIPCNEFDRLVTLATINEELADMLPDIPPFKRSDTASYIFITTRRVFAILVTIGKGPAILDFVEEHITDSDLPLCMPKEAGWQFLTPEGLQTRSGCTIQAVTSWDPRDVEDFSRTQWWFLDPIFDERAKHYELADDLVLPFIEDHEGDPAQMKSGGYSSVWGVRIHHAHQTIYRPTDQVGYSHRKRLEKANYS